VLCAWETDEFHSLPQRPIAPRFKAQFFLLDSNEKERPLGDDAEGSAAKRAKCEFFFKGSTVVMTPYEHAPSETAKRQL